MSSSIIVDFHTHKQQINPNSISIRSYSIDEYMKEPPAKHCTVGIHPWYADIGSANNQIELLADFLQTENVIGLGEVGLDKIQGLELDTQIHILKNPVSYTHLTLPTKRIV